MMHVRFHIHLGEARLTDPPEAAQVWNQELTLALQRMHPLALEALRFHTPVRTGRLQAGWTMAAPVLFHRRVAVDAVNTVHYGPYVDRRKHFVAKAKRDILPLLRREVALALRRIRARLGGRA